MTDFFSRLAERAMGLAYVVQPLTASLYEPTWQAFTDDDAPLALAAESEIEDSPTGKPEQKNLRPAIGSGDTATSEPAVPPTGFLMRGPVQTHTGEIAPPSLSGAVSPILSHFAQNQEEEQGQEPEPVSSASLSPLAPLTEKREARETEEGARKTLGNIEQFTDHPHHHTRLHEQAEESASSVPDAPVTESRAVPTPDWPGAKARHDHTALPEISEFPTRAAAHLSSSPETMDLLRAEQLIQASPAPAAMREHDMAPQQKMHSQVITKENHGPRASSTRGGAGEAPIHVSIGRIEVRALPAPAPTAARSRQRLEPPIMSLDDYLRQREKGGRS